MQTILGIESTAHTLGIAVARGKMGKEIEIISNCAAKYPPSASGYIPRKLAEHHAEKFSSVLSESLEKSGTKLSQVDFIAYSYGPGMGHCLQVGYEAAKSLGVFLGIPIIPVNHAIAHAEVVKHLEGATDPLIVYVSGGNTQILFLDRGNRRYRVLGETLDIGIGNFLDQVGRSLELGPPDAVGVLKLAALPDCNYVELPYVVKGMSVSYSGMLTCAQKLAKKGVLKKDLSYSAQETAFAALCEASERALLHADKKEIVLCGGNARNKRLAQMMGLVAEENGARLFVGADEYLGDNAGMIALTGLLMAQAGAAERGIDPRPVQDLRIDGEEIFWQKV
jgi:glycoprotease/Kae1 family metallohydrolase